MSLYASSLLTPLCLFFFLLNFSSFLLSFSLSTLMSAVEGAEKEVEKEEKEEVSEVVVEDPKKYLAALLKDRMEEFFSSSFSTFFLAISFSILIFLHLLETEK